MTEKLNYKKTLIACYLGFVTQAISANFAPLLFLTFKSSYGISFEKIAMIPLVFYLTQLLVDLAATKFADKIGYRTCVVFSQILSAVGLVLMAFLPEVVPSPFIGILISVVLYAIGSGLIEVLVSPIVEACPFENKEGTMSLLHSFYCWGAMGVIIGSTLFFSIFGVENWKILTVIWALVPLYNTFNFINCPIERLVEDGKSMGIKNLLKTPIFWLMIILMVCSGASEATMAQWASAFTESAIGVSKTVGDLAGPCAFAMFMGVSRMLYGKFSEKLDLTKVMLGCGILCAWLLFVGIARYIANSRTCRLCSLWFSSRHYVAGFYKPILEEMSAGWNCYVCVFSVSRRFGCYGKPIYGGNAIRNGRWQSESRTACGYSFPYRSCVCIVYPK